MSDVEVFTCEQGSYEWLLARLGIPTASQFGAALAKGPKGGVSKTRRTYMLKLVGEILTGRPAENFQNAHTERGKRMEADALAYYENETFCEAKRIGFIRRGRAGCSPDALIDGNGMVEIKTKLPHLQLEALLTNELPAEHKAQVQGQLWIAGREWVDFISYWPGLPPLVVRVNRDETYIDNLKSEVQTFLAEMDEVLAAFAAKGALPRTPVTVEELKAINAANEFDNLEEKE
jgi:hypothetical protein